MSTTPDLLAPDLQTQPSATHRPSTPTLRHRFLDVRESTMRMIAPLSAEDMMVQSCPEASPVKWHLAHTSWFFETFVLQEFVPGYTPFDADFPWLFNSYYNALGAMPAKKLRSSFSRPSLDRILGYRSAVDDALLTLLDHPPTGARADDLTRTVVLGLQHEQQHLELIATDIKHALFTNPLRPALLSGPWQPASRPAAPLTWSSFSPGLVEIGVTPDPDLPETFSFDNETPRHLVYLEPFELGNRLVTCAEYLAFLDDGGYIRPELWLSEGWSTPHPPHPLYWQQEGGAGTPWSIFTAHGLRPLNDLRNAPVCHLSFFEADAFARWAGCRLPTEFEWEFAAGSAGEAQLLAQGNLLEEGSLHPEPARPSAGLQQMFGDVWEWTQSPYTGYPGYRPLPGALGEYNGKFMSSQMILRGGSCVTPRSHIRATYRNFFSPGTQWQFSGLRLARNAQPAAGHTA